MFERFTERARQVVILAQENARQTKHPYIETEHLLYGLCAEEYGLAARALLALGLTKEMTLSRIVVGTEDVPSGQVPFTPRVKKALEGALREALSMGHNYISTEHILLALIHESEGSATRILGELGIDAHGIRAEVVRQLTSSGRLPIALSSPAGLTLTLSREAVNWLWQAAAGMPHNHKASEEVYRVALVALSDHDAKRAAA